jgi:hypothetical protein
LSTAIDSTNHLVRSILDFDVMIEQKALLHRATNGIFAVDY